MKLFLVIISSKLNAHQKGMLLGYKAFNSNLDDVSQKITNK